MAYKILSALSRRKTSGDDEDSESKLNRVLNLVDLTALGVGSTLGLGVYVLAGDVAKQVAGPAVCISFLVAAIASGVSGICYAEFAARVPKAGSAYVYSYVSVGEFIAYIIGWNLILEYVIGTASVARGLSNYVDALCTNQISEGLRDVFPMNVDFFSKYPDFLSFAFVFLLTILLSIGVKESTRLNNILTVLNLSTIVLVLISGSIKADVKNWKIKKEDIPEKFRKDAGEGGFMPFGVKGITKGAAKCFYGFVGFDAVATTGEEAKNPQKNIPLAIVVSLLIIFGAYFGISTVLTMMWPYYDQDVKAPFPYVYDQIGWTAISKIVTTGAVIALCTSLLGALFPLPRIIYAMSNDGLIFKFFAKIHARTMTPLIATICSGLLSGIMAIIFDVDQLIDMMSIGTLLAYTIVAVCVVILRYQNTDNNDYPGLQLKEEQDMKNFSIFSFKQLFNLNMNKETSNTTSAIVNWTLAVYALLTALLCGTIVFALDIIDTDHPYIILELTILALGMIVAIVIISRQPTDKTELTFKVPLVPFVPCLSILFNLYLMLELSAETWMRFGVWLILGFIIYFFYGIGHSEQKNRDRSNEIKSKEPQTKQVTKF